MTKKRFSLLINEDDNTTNALASQLNKEERARFTLKTKETEKETDKIPFSRKVHYWLIENNAKFLHRTYGLQINYNNQKTIHYLLEVKCEGYKKGIFDYSLQRKQFFKDGEELGGFMEQLAAQSASCLYPLKVKVNKLGQIINVTNQEEIKARWGKKQKELAKRYVGKPFVSYCKKITDVVNSSEKIVKSLGNDVGYDILFSEIYMNYTKKFSQSLEKGFKWFSGVQKVGFYGNQSVNPILKENNRMLITYEGNMKPVGGLEKGETQIKYELDAKDNSLLRVDGIFNYVHNNVDKTIQFKAIWQESMDKTVAQQIAYEKQKGMYFDESSEKKWYQLWK
ncbi:hypothetical protein LNJ08_12150 [Tenacibaculum finnmarkense genomovar ulcerans]|uniref:hypothetical protein n=1 Tax=Tenacibaculum finnmarkense TaxID=2781243 RepID=UPI001E556866|nr:hypothetical protein [Tenacibaculum finnmarkense]MCD8455141.1 hypothetical protein [Tenacibaculum finnmarkense genomovar ulcerans]